LNNPISITDNLDVLHQLFTTATDDASTAMCRWTNGLITLSLDEVLKVPLFEVTEKINFSDQLLTMVILTIEGEAGGNLLLTFDEPNGRKLAATLLARKEIGTGDWNDLEISALNETGNIVGCAYLNALTRLIDCDIVPSPPHFVQDYGEAVLQQVLMVQAMSADDILVCRTGFHRDGEDLNWNVIFVPNDGMRLAMEQAFSTSL